MLDSSPARPATVLVVDDDADIRDLIIGQLHQENYRLLAASSLAELRRPLREEAVDLIVLDLNLPDGDGLMLCRELRAEGADVQIIMVTARGSAIDRVLGLELGADDYLTKPFDLGELVARLHALLRRAHHSDPGSDTLTVGSLTIDTARRLVFVAGERVELTKREFDLLAALAENAGVVLSRQRLLELVWGYDFDVDTNVADVFVSYLRRKLERDGLPRVIHTVRGIGYVLREDP